MADITNKISRKSLKLKKKYAIKTVKDQAREKIHDIKIQYAKNPERQQAKVAEHERRKALHVQKANARLAYNARDRKSVV